MLTQLIIALFLVFSSQPQTDLKELLPGIYVAQGVVEFEGSIAIDCHHPDTPDVFLEMLVTAPDSREHESLVVSSIKPSALHAALLAAGFEPGNPISRDQTGKHVPASGDRVSVLVMLPPPVESTLSDSELGPSFIAIETWVMKIESEEGLLESQDWEGLVFAGSKLNVNGYAADRGGTLISLTSFGDEVIAPTWTITSQADIDEPVWIANREVVPKQGTPVRIRIELIDDDQALESHQPDRIDIDRDP